MMFDDEEQDEEFFAKKQDRILNGTIDSILRGTGVGGAIISTLKNAAIKMHEENKKSPWKREDNALLIELLQLSPPIGIKARKLKQAENVLKFDQDLIEEKSILDIENPVYEAGALATEALTNVPLARLHTKTENLQQAFNAENEWWQRLAMALGWSQWNLGITDKEVEAHKEKVKKNKKSKKKSKAVFNY
jgi:hypothetical protein